MRELLFHKRLVVALAGAATLAALTACGGGAGNSDASAPVAQSRAQEANETDTEVTAEQPAPQDLAATDEGAGTRELR